MDTQNQEWPTCPHCGKVWGDVSLYDRYGPAEIMCRWCGATYSIAFNTTLIEAPND